MTKLVKQNGQSVNTSNAKMLRMSAVVRTIRVSRSQLTERAQKTQKV